MKFDMIDMNIWFTVELPFSGINVHCDGPPQTQATKECCKVL